MSERFPFWKKALAHIVLFVMRHVTRTTRLEKVDMLSIGSTLEEAIELYGEPIEEKRGGESDDGSGESEEDDGSITYLFDLTFHEAVVKVSGERVVMVSYWSNPGDASPSRDLDAILKFYGEGLKWCDMTPGYSKVRSDGRRRANFSAMPAIGVEEVDYPGYRDGS